MRCAVASSEASGAGRGQHDKLVAAQPRERIAFVQAGADGRRDVPDQPVAEHMAVVVVDLLEVVEVEEQDADRLVDRRARNGGADLVLNRVAIGEAGQGVGVGQFGETFLRAAFLGDVRARADQELLVDAAAALHELVAKQEEPLAVNGLHEPFDFVRDTAVEEAGNVLARRRARFG